jgi:hypothetical protein
MIRTLLVIADAKVRMRLDAAAPHDLREPDDRA